KEAHIQYDIIENSQIASQEAALGQYRLLILPEITHLDGRSLDALQRITANGSHLIATNRSLSEHPEALERLFGAKIREKDHNGAGFYLQVDDKRLFERLKQQELLFWKFNLGLYEFPGADETHLPIYTPGIPGPPEIIGGHEATGHYAAGIKQHADSRAALLPVNLGKLYYLHGYEQHKNILLDLIDHIFPEVDQLIQTDTHEKVEVILQKFALNTPENYGKEVNDGLILHLVNLTGFSGNTYFNPLPVYNSQFRIQADFVPKRVWSMVTEKDVDFVYRDGYIRFELEHLGEYEGVVMER